jgi:hypothetical protein
LFFLWLKESQAILHILDSNRDEENYMPRTPRSGFSP